MIAAVTVGESMKYLIDPSVPVGEAVVDKDKVISIDNCLIYELWCRKEIIKLIIST